MPHLEAPHGGGWSRCCRGLHPHPYGRASSTSKIVILSKSDRPDCDVDYLFGQVSIDAPVIDWSGNCGNLSTAVGPFAIDAGLVSAPADGTAVVTHGLLLIADQLKVLAQGLPPILDCALHELMRAQTVEFP